MLDKVLISSIPTKPGVYFFKKQNKIIYIGKAKSLKKRVSSYFQQSIRHTNKTKLLINNTENIDWMICKNEVDALLVEANLIKKHRPYYNVLLKDDKTFPFIRITKEPFPKVEIIRSKNLIKDENIYFGPYTDTGYLRNILKILHKAFKLRTCSFYIDNKTIKAGKHSICLDFHINKCDGPCEGYISENNYNMMINQVIRFLKGDSSIIKKQIFKSMEEASNNLEFEVAGDFRDQLTIINSFLNRQKKICHDFINRDVIAILSEDSDSICIVLKIRNGNLLGIERFELKRIDSENISESLRQFLIQYYYETSDIPSEIIVNTDISNLSSFNLWIEVVKGKKVKLIYPKRGLRFDLMRTCLENATSYISFIKKNKIKRSLKPSKILSSLKNDLNLETVPRRIEAFDISNISGTNSVGAMVCFIDGKKIKREYRKYKIQTVKGIDDFASIREVIDRRYTKVLKEKLRLPDLILIDGGKGQLSAAKSTLNSMGLGYINIIGLAKRLEEIFIPETKEPQNISKSSLSLLLLRKIRDEVHRFAITFHRSLRDKEMVESKFINIKGVGKKCIGRIWGNFETLDEIKNSSINTIAKKLNISKDIAKKIKLIA